MGLPAAAAERRDPAVHQLHPVEEQGDRRLQDCRPGWASQVRVTAHSMFMEGLWIRIRIDFWMS